MRQLKQHAQLAVYTPKARKLGHDETDLYAWARKTIFYLGVDKLGKCWVPDARQAMSDNLK